MMLVSTPSSESALPLSEPKSIWREREFWIVLGLAVLIYAPRLTTLSIRGEESRRAVIAQEMIDTGDWVVPRTQGVVRLSRPPVQNWIIAGLALAQGEMNAFAVRFPGLVATALTVGLIYWYCRRRFEPTASLVAAVAYASMLHVLEQGRTGETEPLFALVLPAALLFWHALWIAQRPWQAWIVGGTIGGLAMMTKGIQAPLYFFGSTWCYLLFTRNWRSLFTRAHLVGAVLFFSSIGLWQALFMSQTGFEAGWRMYYWNIETRFVHREATAFWQHFATYPIAVFGACLAPWSFLLLGFADKRIREALAARGDLATFAAVCVIVCFPSTWLPPDSRPRYFMPLFPCCAILIGAVMQGLLDRCTAERVPLWTIFVRAAMVIMAAAAVLVPILAAAIPQTKLLPPPVAAMLYSMTALVCAGLVYRWGEIVTAPTVQRVCVTFALFLGCSYVGPVITSLKQRSGELPRDVATLKATLPADAQLVSFGQVHHAFLYYFHTPVPLCAVPQSASDVPEKVEYFCLDVHGRERPDLPFAWEEVALLPIDRVKRATPREAVLVGRRLSATPLTVSASEASRH